MKQNLWLTLATCLGYCVDKKLWKAIDYLKEQVQVLKEQREQDKRILLNDRQRITLATKAKQLTRELLEATTVLFTPETVLGWYRKLIAQKYDGRANCKNPGQPRVSQEITDLVIPFRKENPRWGCTRIRDYIVHLGYRIGETTVERILSEHGFDREPDLTSKTIWKGFIKRHRNVLAACDFFPAELLVRGKLVPVHGALCDRPVNAKGEDPRRPPPAQRSLDRADRPQSQLRRQLPGRQEVLDPRSGSTVYGQVREHPQVRCCGTREAAPRSPNSNAHAELFVRSIKEEFLAHLILSSEEQLRYVLTGYLQYCYQERIYQGINKIIEPQHEANQGEIIRIERLSGLLKSYHRKAA